MHTINTTLSTSPEERNGNTERWFLCATRPNSLHIVGRQTKQGNKEQRSGRGKYTHGNLGCRVCVWVNQEGRQVQSILCIPSDLPNVLWGMSKNPVLYSHQRKGERKSEGEAYEKSAKNTMKWSLFQFSILHS